MLRLMLSALAVSLGVIANTPAADPKPFEPFEHGSQTDLGKHWQFKDKNKYAWTTFTAALDDTDPKKFKSVLVGRTGNDLVNDVSDKRPSSDIYTKEKFGDITLELEFMVPKGSNSGIYLMGEYEVQILDSYGKPDEKLTQGDLGALYSAAAPKKNASKKPGEWQKFVIEFQAPKFDGDKKTANAKFVKVTLNDVVLHENVEMKKNTPGGLTGKEAATGPLMFQGDHGPVAFRNIKITPKK
jgi:hypothetical protein